ncbi:MAG: hypothetical protein WCA46_28805 [Actinocatenispora sp.]
MPAPLSGPPWLDTPAARARAQRRRLLIGSAVSAALVLLAGIVLTIGVTRSPDDTDTGNDPGSALTAAPAVRLTAAFGDGAHTVHADLTVSQAGYATGTLTDPDGGSAALRADSRDTALRGDTAWWADRAPDRIDALAGHWTRAGADGGLPVQVARALRPRVLGHLVAAITRGAHLAPVPGTHLMTATSDGWSVRYDRRTRRIDYLGGPIDGGGFTPTGHRGPARVVPIGNGVQQIETTDGGSFLAAAPEPADNRAAQRARDETRDVLPDAASSGPSVSAPPRQEDQKPKKAEFEPALNTSYCGSDQCSFSVTVTNTGDESGSALVVADASPGLPSPAEVEVGPIGPGDSATTGPITFANPAPEPTQDNPHTEVQVHYSVAAYPAIADTGDSGGKPDARGETGKNDPYQGLVRHGLDPTDNATFNALDADHQYAVAQALNHMLADGVPADTAVKTMQDAVDKGLLNALTTFATTGGLQNWKDLPTKLNAVPASTDKRWRDKVGYRREIEAGQRILEHNPNAKIIIDGEYQGCNADIFDLTNKGAYQLKSSTGQTKGFRAKAKEAIVQLNGEGGVATNGIRECTPPGFTRIAQIIVEPASPLYENDREQVVASLGNFTHHLCDGSEPRLELFRVITGKGTFEWRAGDFGDFGAPC